MPRKLRPCGTRAAYQRHLYNKEEPCEACKAANVVRAMSAPSGGGKPPREIDPNNYWVTQGDKALEANPPVIVWRYCPFRKVQVPVSVHDPHADTYVGLSRSEALARYYEIQSAERLIEAVARESV